VSEFASVVAGGGVKPVEVEGTIAVEKQKQM
jgi:hypothetical protein